ncbi:extracellular solute-binding protein [Lachnoclostridium sp. Marseille-P6806]|uniref:extracellular solute-binding protein n=1 Tax=Lachnoclostridium sp. Marseille-P6806 TaxID=2364793 RepID=UPI0013EF56EF|nr:extracellular solute-binding protein [Lachnoclostridium sp. Marseille-P6806]
MKRHLVACPLVSCSGIRIHPFLTPILGVSLAAAALLGGCSPAPEIQLSSALSEEPITLNVCVWADELTYVTAAADAYNAISKDVAVRVLPLSNDDYDQHVDDVLIDSAVYDLVGIKGIAKTVQLANKDLILDLTDYIRDSIARNTIDTTAYGNMFNDITYQDRYYAIPTRTTCWALFYNKELFDQANLPYPGQMTWAEYTDLAQKLTDSKNNIYGGYFLPWIPNCIALQGGSYLTDDDTSPLRQSLQLLNSLYATSHISYYEMEDVENPPENVYNTFEDGRVAMVPNGEWMVNLLLQDEAAGKSIPDWDIAPMPVSPGQENGSTWGQYQYMSICSSTKHPVEAFDFLLFLCGRPGAEIYANHAIIPAYSDDQIAVSYQKAAGHDSAHYFFESKKMQEQLPIPGYQETIEIFNREAKSYFAGEQTLDEAMEHFETERSAIFAAP